MIRVGLLLYLLLATAAGPGLCCCLADGFGNLLTKNSQKKTCCPNHGQEKKETPAKNPTGPCPCKEDRVSPNPALAVEKGDIFGQPVWQLASAYGFFPTALMISDSGAIDLANLRFTCLTGQELLRATHVLRC